MNRYFIEAGSDGGHYGFEWSVLDRKDPEVITIALQDTVTIYACICECFDKASADKICGALNAVDRVAENVARIIEKGHNIETN